MYIVHQFLTFSKLCAMSWSACYRWRQVRVNRYCNGMDSIQHTRHDPIYYLFGLFMYGEYTWFNTHGGIGLTNSGPVNIFTILSI